MRKSVAAVVVLFFVIASCIAIFAFLFQTNNTSTDSEHNQANIKITDFSINDHWAYLGGLVFDCSFNLIVENKGADNVTDLELKVKVYSNNSEVQVGNYFFGTYENGTIKQPLGAYEVREFKGVIMTTVGADAYRLNLASNETSIVAMILLNNTVLDKRPSA
jgi:hypothetical protein